MWKGKKGKEWRKIQKGNEKLGLKKKKNQEVIKERDWREKNIQEGQKGGSDESGRGESHLHKWRLESQKGERVKEERKLIPLVTHFIDGDRVF